MTHSETRAHPSSDPVIFVADDNPATLRTIERDLERRFGRDYRIVTSPSLEAGIRALERLAAASSPVALICASLQMQAMSGVEFL